MSNRLKYLTRDNAPWAIFKDPSRRLRTTDALQTYDQATIDSTGVFLIGELERLDQTLHDPLVAVTWGRDIDLREDVTPADEVSSFTNSSFAAAGGVRPGGKAWASKDANAITGVALDIGKTAQPLTLWAMEVKFTVPELISAQAAGRPVDTQKYEGMKLKYNMDIDEMVYTGDTDLGYKGLVNNDAVITHAAVANGSQGTPQWTTKTPDEILADVNSLLSATWQAAGWAVIPNRLLLPPAQYSYIVQQKVSQAGNMSILRYLLENNLTAEQGSKLEIRPLKWLIGQGVGGTPKQTGTVDRMVAYTQDKERVRYPLTLIQRTPLEYRSLYQITTYWARLGVVEFVYPETLQYADGI